MFLIKTKHISVNFLLYVKAFYPFFYEKKNCWENYLFYTTNIFLAIQQFQTVLDIVCYNFISHITFFHVTTMDLLKQLEGVLDVLDMRVAVS